jgi:probable HAF family extracellular repeat protein
MFNQILGLYGLKMRDGAGLERGAAGGVRRNRPRSSVVVFEPPAGLTSTTAVGINNKGQVAIGSDAGVLLWERGAYTHLGPGYPTAINGEGWILGTTPRGVAIFRKGHRSQPLSINLIPTGFNDCGEVSGYVGPGCSGCGSHALYWHAGQLTTLAPSSGPADHLGARALGLNNRGQVVGTSESDTSQGRTHALIWRDGRVSDLGCFGGDHAAARGINDRGQIIVTSYSVATCMARTFLVDGGRVIELGSPSRWGGEHAEALNNHGDVVGDANGSPFLWRKGVMTDIRTLIPAHVALTVVAATGINDSGAIVGYGFDINGGSRGFLLKAGD